MGRDKPKDNNIDTIKILGSNLKNLIIIVANDPIINEFIK